MARTKRYVAKDPEERAQTRKRALALRGLEAPAAIARLFSVNRSTVQRWFDAEDARGKDAVVAPEATGRKQLLTGDEIARMIELLKHPPSRYRIEQRNDAWTWDGVTELFESQLKREFVRQTVQRALRREGWDL
jgi:transposase